jgi:hypothetical protein
MTTTDGLDHRGSANNGAHVASYATAYGALLAVEHLADHGVPIDTLRVIPAEIEISEQLLDRSRRRVRTVRPVAVGLFAAAVSMVILAPTPGLTVIGAGIALIICGAAAIVTRWIERWYAERVRTQARSARTVEAGRFDVISNEAPHQAARLLARWWDPHAPPVAPVDATTPRHKEALNARRVERAA